MSILSLGKARENLFNATPFLCDSTNNAIEIVFYYLDNKDMVATYKLENAYLELEDFMNTIGSGQLYDSIQSILYEILDREELNV